MDENKHNPKKTEEDAVKEHLTKQFKKLGKEEVDVPDDLKDEVFHTLDTLNLAGDFLDLFTSKFIASEATLLDLADSSEEEIETE